ncbi:MAG: hypothetical protein H6810_00810 [Phycisphaeraceae bacterium]|nr:MAG: hypothetical protein H6810_00810 [Phycisphaeraceae bacterium]
MHSLRPSLLALAAASTAHATVLTFDNFDSVAHDPVLPDYGDRVTTTLDPGTGYTYGMGNGFTPGIVVDYLPDVTSTFEVWDGYADLFHALGDNSYTVPGEVVFTADPGMVVVLNGFDLAPWNIAQPDATVIVTDEAGHVLFSRVYSTGGLEITTSVAFPGGLRGQEIHLRVNNFGDWAIDNVDFDQEASTPPCNLADLAAPYGLLDLSDITTFISAFTGGDPLADLDGNGLFDLTDVTIFVTQFTAGCP